MGDQQTMANVQQAIAFLQQAGFVRLLERLRAKYVQIGHVGGQIVIEDSTAHERRELSSFLGKAPYHHGSITVKLTDIDTALRHSRFACTLPDVLSAFFPDQPLITRKEQKATHLLHQTDFHTALTSIATELSQESRGRSWLAHGQHGQEWLFSRYKNAPTSEQEQQLALIRYIASILDRLPEPGSYERLALFAQRTSGNPHTLDPDRAAGRLFLFALEDLAKDQEPVTSAVQRDRAQELRLYDYAGLLVDGISSSVAVFNLASAWTYTGTLDPLLQIAGERVLLLPLRQLQEWQRVLPTTPEIYVIENPQVFEEVITGLLRQTRSSQEKRVPDSDENFSPASTFPDSPKNISLPTIVCTSGWPSLAAQILLDLLVDQSTSTCLYYSGDFDLKGLQIAAHLMTRYPDHCHPWHFDPTSYLCSLQSDGVVAPPNELAMLNTLPNIFAPLVATMQEKAKWAYQEGITPLLLADVGFVVCG